MIFFEKILRKSNINICIPHLFFVPLQKSVIKSVKYYDDENHHYQKSATD